MPQGERDRADIRHDQLREGQLRDSNAVVIRRRRSILDIGRDIPEQVRSTAKAITYTFLFIRYKYRNAETKNLWEVFDEVTGKDCSGVMKDWTLNEGYPLVEVFA